MPKKHLGLRLTLGGAPDTPHTIPGLPGQYRPSRATPVGGQGEPTEEQAREADKKRGTAVELVELTEKELEKARELHNLDVEAARSGVLLAAQDGAESVAEQDNIDDQRAAVGGR